MKKYRKAILKITVSLALLGFLFWKVDKREIIENIRLLNFAYAPLIIGFIIVHYAIGAFRWKKFLVFENCERISVKYLFYLYFVGAFFNNFMPTSVGGDAVKFLKLGEKIKSKTNAFTATFMERFTGVMALVVVSYYGLVRTLPFWVSQLPENLASNGIFVTLFKIFLFVGFWIGMAVAFLSMKVLSKKIG
ncbi:MAG: lysylphosphatidylglycerol synthase transmembrane domain-containing protein, partial [Patescibacteria group bacterium]